jgi:DNA end-binding protein Ku
VPLESVDPVYFENSYYLGADKGGEKPYRLLADALQKMKRIAVA